MTIEDIKNKILCGDALETLKQFPDNCIDCCVTSPPYFGLRDYGVDGQIGIEETPELFVSRLCDVFDEVRRVLKPTGTCWVNLGDSYAAGPRNGTEAQANANSTLGGSTISQSQALKQINKITNGLKQKDLIGIPWMVAFELRKRGWYLRQDIIWHKPNPMPESVTDRCTKAHEYIFLLSKSAKYYYDAEAIKEESIHFKTDSRAGYGRIHYRGKRQGQEGTGQENFVSISEKANKRSVWKVSTMAYKGAHFATFPELLIIDCIKAGSSEYGCCSACGKPYIREFTKELIPTGKASYNSKIDNRDIISDKNDQGSNRQKDGHKPGWINKTETTGWNPTCKCNSEITRTIILDPFSGAGTTALVSCKLNRSYVGIELNPAYAKMGLNRVGKAQGIFAQ